MSLRTPLVAVAIAAATLLPAASAVAADHSAELTVGGTPFAWTSDVQSGAVVVSDVADRAPACSPIFGCDTTLVHTDARGNLQVDITGTGVGGQDTLKDVDLHIYLSDADGTPVELYGESTGETADESYAIEDADPGYYLVVVDWYLGVGSVDGTAALQAPTTPVE